MKNEIPFTTYEFWAYLLCGFALLFLLDHAFQTGLLIHDEWLLVEGLFAIAVAYGAGQVLASLSSKVFERWMVHSWLGLPSLHLMGVRTGPQLLHKLLPNYVKPLPEATRRLISARASRELGVAYSRENDDAVFWAAFAVMKGDPVSRGRVETFLNQYGMSRNLAMATLIGAVALLIGAVLRCSWEEAAWAGGVFAFSAAMLERYLKFYRHYAVEVLTTYAHLDGGSVG